MMRYTQSALTMLLLFWTLQVAGSWMQWKHYHRALAQATRRWGDGYVGVGRARSRIGFSVIAMLEVSPDLAVRRLQTMSGLTVFAKFKTLVGVEDRSLDDLARQYANSDSRAARAIRQAIGQVEEARKKPA